MTLRSQKELDVSREKLRLLEDRYESSRATAGTVSHAQALSLRSLKQLINQLKEEIARFEAQPTSGTAG
jgi:uncharacterized small protein (DUF1192 family)